MSPTGLEEASTAVGLGAKVLSAVRRPFAAIAFRLAGLSEEDERDRRETRRLMRAHVMKECDALDALVDKVEELGPKIERGIAFEEESAAYAGTKHRLRNLDPQLPALCDTTARAMNTPPEWQKIAQLARPAIAARRRAALS